MVSGLRRGGVRCCLSLCEYTPPKCTKCTCGAASHCKLAPDDCIRVASEIFVHNMHYPQATRIRTPSKQANGSKPWPQLKSMDAARRHCAEHRLPRVQSHLADEDLAVLMRQCWAHQPAGSRGTRSARPPE